MTKSTEVLVAAQLLIGGSRDKDGVETRAELGTGAELTAAATKALGLSESEIADLKERGVLIPTPARVADSADAAALDAALARIAELEQQVEQLTANLAAATATPKDSGAKDSGAKETGKA